MPDKRREIVEKILAMWEKAPDLRLGQLLCNAALRNGADDLYYIDDDKLLAQMQEFVDKQA